MTPRVGKVEQKVLDYIDREGPILESELGNVATRLGITEETLLHALDSLMRSDRININLDDVCECCREKEAAELRNMLDGH